MPEVKEVGKPPDIGRQPPEGRPNPHGRPLVSGGLEKFRDLVCGHVGNGPEAQKGQTLSRGHCRQGAGFQVQNRPRQTGQRPSLTFLVNDAAGGDHTAGDRGEPRLLEGSAEEG